MVSQDYFLSTNFSSMMFPTISITDSYTGKHGSLPHKEVKDPHRRLGAILTAGLDQQGEIIKLRFKSVEFAQSLQYSYMPSNYAWRFNQSIYIPTMCFTLPATIIPMKTMNSIQALYKRAILHMFGYPVSFPNAVTYGPAKRDGFGLQHLSAYEGKSKGILLLWQFQQHTKLLP
jgi:hypothetical protein